MRRIFRHALILTLALALVANAAAWRQCAALQIATADLANIEHASHGAHHHANPVGHSENDHHAMRHQHAVDDPATPAADDHGCMKCCTMCMVANVLTTADAMTVTFTISTHVFRGDEDMRSGSTIAVDPGIPKRMG
jgi:hypothetical protein